MLANALNLAHPFALDFLLPRVVVGTLMMTMMKN